METHIQQWGNSLAVRLPKAAAHQLRLKVGSLVRVTPKKGKITIAPVQKKVLTLKELVRGITPENRHEETDWGPPVGKEVW